MAISFLQAEGHGVDDGATIDIEAAASTIRSVLPPLASPASGEQLGRSLLWLASLKFILALTSVFHQPAAGPVFSRYTEAFYAILAFVLLVVVPVELGTAFCLPRCTGGRRLLAFARGLLPCA